MFYRGVLAAVAACFACAPASAAVLTFDPGTYIVKYPGPPFTTYQVGDDYVSTNGDISGGQVNGTAVQFGGAHPWFSLLSSFDAKGSGELRVRVITHDGPIPDPVATFALTSDFQHFALGAGPGQFTLLESDSLFAIDNADFVGVPEPASWALMIGGFGLVGGAMRTRRSASSRRAALR